MTSQLYLENMEQRNLFAVDSSLELPVPEIQLAETFEVAPEPTGELVSSGQSSAPLPAAEVDAVFAAGDADRDGDFDQNDVVQLLQHGKYLGSRPADWSEGDFTGDGRFDQTDIVTALQTGGYAHKPYHWWDGDLVELIYRGGW